MKSLYFLAKLTLVHLSSFSNLSFCIPVELTLQSEGLFLGLLNFRWSAYRRYGACDVESSIVFFPKTDTFIGSQILL